MFGRCLAYVWRVWGESHIPSPVRYVKKYVDRGNIPDYDLAVYTNNQEEKRLFVQPWDVDQHYFPPGDVIATSRPRLNS